MTIREQNFEMFAGDSKLISVEVVDEEGNAKDLTDADIKWALRRLSDDLVEKETPATIVITDAVNGKFVVSVSPNDTKSFFNGLYKHQAMVTDQSGVRAVVLEGVARIYGSLFKD